VTTPLPHLRATGTGQQLVVDGRPALLLGGQLHNSTSSDPHRVREVMTRLAAQGIRTVIGTVSWAQVEPVEGTLDLASVDAQVAAAEELDLRLVLIWFGAFKNAASTYAPSWVRSDTARFPRAEARGARSQAFTYPGGMPKPVLSVFGPELLAADRRAYVEFLRHLAEVDRGHRVVMVQVENEVGLLGDSRDRSPVAEQAWSDPVPAELLARLAREDEAPLRPELSALWARQGRRTTGTWAEVFGDDWEADEAFMAWGFASYCGALAAAGKEVTALPTLANAWLGPQPGQPEAGDYPSGGPVGRVLDLWRAAAPAIDLLGPDLYGADVKPVMADYHRPDNPLFVPESALRTGSLFWALGTHRALGFCVFGVDDVRPGSQLGDACTLLGSIEDRITAAQAEDRIAGVLLEAGQTQQRFSLGGYDVVARDARALLDKMLLDVGVQGPPPAGPRPSETEGPDARPSPADGRPFGIVLAEGADEFLLVGQGLALDLSADDAVVEVDAVEEGTVVDGAWVPGRLLNGDERLFVLPGDRLGMVCVRVLRRPR
jgi:hypothetical protein